MPLQHALGFFIPKSGGRIIPPAGTIYDIDGNLYHWITIGTQQWMVENLKTTKYADLTPIPNLTLSAYDDWFLPSKDELNAMYTELYLYAVGGFDSGSYNSSSEFDSTDFWYNNFAAALQATTGKSSYGNVRACRAFTAGVGEYSLRDTGPAGGLIFYVSSTSYLEAAPTDQSLNYQWSNIITGVTGASGTAIGTGQANTTAIIGQVGHTSSAAKLCDDLSLAGWINDTTGAYCYYNNDIANKADYGALYNWYAVDNAHGLAPTGWRVPSDADFATLVAFLGGDTVAGGKLKEQGLAHWLTPNTGATDDYGFKALGAGYRDNLGVFINLETYSGFSLSTLFAAGFNDNIQLFNNHEYLSVSYDCIASGYSVRCMRDVV